MTETMVRIAVVDNDPAFLALLSDVFALREWELVPCEEGARALEVLRRERPDIIILDIWLDAPYTGWGLLQRLKADPAMEAIPIIVCSGDASHLEAKAAWLADHGIVTLPKPFNLDELYRVVQATLDRGTVDGLRHGEPLPRLPHFDGTIHL
ncbi:MAG: response regulator [Chloroflexi bacterium]|nr:response regulator [Chloroflexota bacterium]